MNPEELYSSVVRKGKEREKMEQDKGRVEINSTFKVFMMSLPIFVELMLQLLVGNVDQIMISQYSQKSVAAIVNANQVMNLVIIVLNMVSMATTVILSQYLGAKDEVSASKTCMVSLTLISAISIVVTLGVLLANRQLFSIINVQPEIMEECRTYLIIVGSFILVQGLYLNFASILRTYTLMKEVMYVSIVMNVLNIVGNAVLINGWLGFPQLGSAGAAISTVISKTIGLGLIILLFYKKVHLPMGFRFLRPFPRKILRNLCWIAFPSGAESFSYNVSQMCILGIVNTFGTMVTATKGYCSILANLSYVYAVALSQATQIVLGYLIGLKRTEDIQKRVWSTMKICLGVCLLVTLILYLNSNLVFRMFTDDPEVLALGKRILFLEFFLEIGRAINIIMTRSLIAVGDVKTPMIAGITGEWILAFGLSFVFGIVLKMGLEGVWIAMALDECIRGMVYVIRFRQGKWKRLVYNH